MRTHDTPLGKFPSVTTILSATRSKADQDKLRKWQHKFDKINGVGAAKQYSDNACNKGTIIHKLIQMQLEGKDLPDCYEFPEIGSVKSFLKTLKVLAVEQKVFHPSGYAGVTDCVAYFDNQLCIIDWKTSKREKKRSWITDYFIQGAAYANAWNYCFPENKCDNILIVILGPKLQLFEASVYDFLPKWEERLALFGATCVS